MYDYGGFPYERQLLTSVADMAQKKKTTSKKKTTTSKKKPTTRKKSVAPKKVEVAQPTVVSSAGIAPIVPKVWDKPIVVVPKKKSWLKRLFSWF